MAGSRSARTGTTANSSQSLARFTEDGTPDPTFGGGVVSFFKAVTRIEEISVFNGKTIVSGWGLRGEGVSGPVLLRFNADGTFDNTLGGDGHVVADIGGFGRGAGHDVQIDGRVYVAVSASRANLTFGVMRLQDNGELDPGFGGGGVAYSNEPPSSGTPVDVLRQQDGALIVGGSLNNGGDLLMTRLTPGGAPDPSFGSNGTVLFDINSSFDSRPSYGLQGNRLIVAASTDGQLFLAAFQLQSNVSAEEDSFSADEDTPALLDVLANDTSPLGTTRTIFSFTQPSHGTLSRAGHATPVRPCRQLPWRGRVPLHRHRWPGQHRRRHGAFDDSPRQ
jgi:uncharacterized delta-60 repeat protein